MELKGVSAVEDRESLGACLFASEEEVDREVWTGKEFDVGYRQDMGTTVAITTTIITGYRRLDENGSCECKLVDN
jgi:hypothetical protein